MDGPIKYRVERWVDYADPDTLSWKHREHYFDTMEEVEEYVEYYKATYRLRVYKCVEALVTEIQPTYDESNQPSPEEAEELVAKWEKLFGE